MVVLPSLLLYLPIVTLYFQNVCHANKEAAASAIFPTYRRFINKSEIEEKEPDLEGLKTFSEVETKLRSIIDEVIRKVLPYVIRASADIRLSGKCMASIFKLVIGMQKLQDWAIKMVDATGKPPSGAMRGTSMSLGDFDECLSIKVEKNKHHFPRTSYGTDSEYFHGKYCIVECRMPKGLLDAVDEYIEAPNYLRFNTSIGKTKTFLHMLGKLSPYIKIASFRFGVCIPSTCNEDDLESITSSATKQIGFPLQVLHCQEKVEVQFKKEHFIILTVLALLILPVLAGTALDYYFSTYATTINHSNTKSITFYIGKIKKVSGRLSIINNTKKLFDVSEKKEHPFPVARGLLFLTVVMNVLAHTYLMLNHLFFFKYSNILNYLEFMEEFSFTFIANGSNGIENYFFIAGFLLTFTRWRSSLVPAKINLVKLLVKPYIRFSLLQLFGLGLFLLFPLFGYGPFFGDFVGPYLENCRTRWWTNLLYIQNYWNSEETCLYHTWVIAVVMQLYVISIAVLWTLKRNTNMGFALMLALIITGMGIVGATIFMKQLPGALSMHVVNLESGIKMFNAIFIQTFDHMGPFCIGLATGYMLAKYKNSIKLRPVLVGLIWCVALASILAVIFGLNDYRYSDERMNPNLSLLYAMLNRNVYALFLAWFFVACATKNAAFIDDILSWKAMIPGYRLSPLAYILHLIVIYYHIGVLREHVYLSHIENVLNFFGYLVTTYILAFLCYVFFQAPYMHFEQAVYKMLNSYFYANPSCDIPEITESTVSEQDLTVGEKQKNLHLPDALNLKGIISPTNGANNKISQVCKV